MTARRLRSDLQKKLGCDLISKVGMTSEGEEVMTNSKPGDARITICVPTWKDSADALLCSLARLPGADQCTLLIFDDGSVDSDLTRQLARHILRYPGPARLVSAPKNCGRSHARNRLKSLAETDWILFLDADMQPDDEDFLNRYLDAIDVNKSPALVAGGFSLEHIRPTQETHLHAAQAAMSECITAEYRALEPGRYTFTSNILVHRDVLTEIEFDPGFTGWGWEDVDWGLRVAAIYPVLHIDNTATHLGLDKDEVLIEKYATSADNFVRLVERHPDTMEATPLYRMARVFSILPFQSQLKQAFLALTRKHSLPIRLRLIALKLFRASVYGARL
ncbi:MAG: glycosyltransferase [Hyphomonadaceae bacterium]|nr:glycosyltransferase [Hyphomonadaceae bacterium]